MKQLTPFKIALIYFLFGILWILLSDLVLEFFIRNPVALKHWQTYKGSFFILLTALMLYGLIKRYSHEIGRSDQALRNHLRFMNTLIDTIPAPVFHKDRNGIYQGCNQVFSSRILGLPKERIIGRSIRDLGEVIPADLAAIYHAQDLDMMREPGTRFYEAQVKCADGIRREYSFSKATFSDASGDVAGIVGVMLDLSYRKQVEEELNRSNMLLRSLIDSIPDLIFYKSTEGKYLGCNQAFADFVRKERTEIIDHTDFDLFPAASAHLFRENDRIMLAEGKPLRHEEQVDDRDGRPLYWDTLKTPYYGPDGQLLGLIGISRNITEQKRVEKALQQSRKLESLGTLAGGVAHDFNNILSGMMGYTEIALQEVPEELERIRDHLQKAIRTGERARSLIRDILTFARESHAEQKPVQPDALIEETLHLLRASFPATIAIERDLRSSGSVLADPTHIQQVIMNLCTNAVHAMKKEHGGRLTVRLDEVTLDAEQHPEVRTGPFLRMTVSDTGHGIPPDICDRIFDPFFTTKEVMEGTGMGLAVVHGIIKRLGGMIRVESVPEEGTSFTVYLPVCRNVARAAVETEIPRQSGSEHILFVDDEEMLTEVGTMMLEALGYSVVAMTESPAALERFRREPDAFDLVMTDLGMPDLPGDLLAREIHALRPDLPIIICTGGEGREISGGAGIKGVAMKPIRMNEIGRLIRSVLDATDTCR